LAISAVLYTIYEKQGADSAAEPFDIGMVTFAGYAPLYLAKEKGFFGDLEVRLHRIEEVASIRAGMASGRLEAYLATTDIAIDTNVEPPGVAIWAIDESSGGDGVVVRGLEGGIEGLKGQVVAAEPGLPPFFILQYLLHENGLDLEGVQFKDMTTQDAASAFSSGAVAAAGLYEPFLSTAMKAQDGSRLAISSAQTPGLIVDLIFVRDDLLEGSTAPLAVVEGWRKAIRFIDEHPAEAYAVMSRAYNLPEDEFRDIAGAVRWLDLADNQVLYGDAGSPGPLYTNFVKIRQVLERNRQAIYPSDPERHLSREVIQQLAALAN
jgi:NitT/TauT family transport system substrate-binding protein